MELLGVFLIVFSLAVGTFGAKPAPPKYTVESTTPTSLTVTIARPPVSGLVGYKIQYQLIGGSKIQKNIELVAKYVIEDLTPASLYRVRLATRASSNGKFGTWTNIQTISANAPERAPSPPPKSPRNLAVDPQSTTVTVSWETPSDNGADISGYKISYGTPANPTANTITVGPQPTRAVLQGLSSDTNYRLSLMAYNDVGNSRPISMPFRTEQEMLPPPPVEDLQFTSTETTVTATWRLPETTVANEILGITVGFGTSEGDLTFSYFDENTVTFTSENLRPDSRYVVTVETGNEQGRSKPISVIGKTLPQPTTLAPTTKQLLTQPPTLSPSAKPPPPKFTMESETPTSITVSIQPVRIAGLIGYKIQYQDLTSNGKKIQKIISATPKYVIEGLKPSTQYRVRMSTRARLNSKYGGWVTINTISDAPVVRTPESPRNIAVDPLTTSATISWDAPVDNGARIIGYKLAYGTSDNPTSRTDTVDASQTSMVLTGLMSNSDYRVFIRAYNDEGDSRPVSIGFQTAEEKSPPPPIENIQYTSTETSVSVTWTLPATTAANEIDSISVRFSTDISNGNEQVSKFDRSTVTYTAENLLPGTTYYVRVFTENMQGISDHVSLEMMTKEPPTTEMLTTMVPSTEAPTTQKVTTEAPTTLRQSTRAPTERDTEPPPEATTENQIAPLTPQDLRVSAIRETSARLTWDLPIDNGAEIQGFVVSYGPMYNPTATTMYVEAWPMESEMVGLEPNTEYSVYVTAYNRGGQSIVPAEIEFWTDGGRKPPSPVENFRSYPNEDNIYFSWGLPVNYREIDLVQFGIAEFGTSLDQITLIDLHKYSRQYTAYNLEPGTRYTAVVYTKNAEGQSEPVTISVETERPPVVPTRPPPDRGFEGSVPPAPVRLQATVVSPTSVKVEFVDSTLEGRSYVDDDRYYTVRFKKEDEQSYQYLNIRKTPPIMLEYLQPEANYEIDVKLVIDAETQSPFTEPQRVFTGENLVRDVTAVQFVVTGPGTLSVLLNWLPPENTAQRITGYIVEYAQGYYVLSSTVWQRIVVEGDRPSAVIENLTGEETYHVRVAPVFGTGIGPFSNPPDAFATLDVPSLGQPLSCDKPGTETEEQIRERVEWMRGRAGMIGVPLPYCDDIYGVHECHGSVCFCIPGRSPAGGSTCNSAASRSPNDLSFADDPAAGSPPCHAEYERTRAAIDEASKAGEPVNNVRLPYCSEDGYYQPKQCLGTMCFCVTRTGKHTGKEVPIWEVQTLNC